MELYKCNLSNFNDHADEARTYHYSLLFNAKLPRTMCRVVQQRLSICQKYDIITKLTKGQLISKGLFDVIVSTKKLTKLFLRISALVSKKRSDQKINKGTLYQ